MPPWIVPPLIAAPGQRGPGRVNQLDRIGADVQQTGVGVTVARIGTADDGVSGQGHRRGRAAHDGLRDHAGRLQRQAVGDGDLPAGQGQHAATEGQQAALEIDVAADREAACDRERAGPGLGEALADPHATAGRKRQAGEGRFGFDDRMAADRAALDGAEAGPQPQMGVGEVQLVAVAQVPRVADDQRHAVDVQRLRGTC